MGLLIRRRRNVDADDSYHMALPSEIGVVVFDRVESISEFFSTGADDSESGFVE